MDLFSFNGEGIRKLRSNLGWSRDELSDKSGVPVRTIQDIESGTVKNPGVETLKKMYLAMDPKYTSPDGRAELVFRIIGQLSALDEDQLGRVNTLIEVMLESSPATDLGFKKA